MTDERTCSQCGSPLPADAPGGACPKCLLGLGLSHSAKATDVYTSPPGQPFLAPPPEEIAAHFPQLEVLELLGQGGMGAVYKARQPALDRLVAVKILPAQISRTPGFAARFAREARALARLSHPNIVAVYDSGERDGLYYFIMEYVDGANLREMMQAGHLEPQQAMAIVPQVCDALQYAHENGVVHRDIKPENILVDKAGRVKIADFGLAKLASGDSREPALALTGTYQVMGTPRYMAPEQLGGSRNVDHRADIYSLGVVFYELLTGELPLGRFDPPSFKVQLDVRLDEVVLRTLENSPDRRYQRASEIRTDLETIGREPARVATQPVAKRERGPLTEDADDAELTVGRYLNRGAALGIVTFGALSLFVALIWLAWIALAEANVLFDAPGNEEGAVFCLLILASYATFVLFVGVRMLWLRWYAFALISSALLTFPLPFVLWITIPFWPVAWRGPLMFAPAVVATIGIPFGIWGAVVLWRDTVTAVYQRAFEQRVFGAAKQPDAPLSADQIRRWVLGPSIGFIVLACLNAAASVVWLVVFFDQIHLAAHTPEFGVAIFLAAGGCAALAVVTGLAGLRLFDLRSHTLGVLAAIFSMLPLTAVVLVGLPIGIWALVVLLRRDVREAFEERSRELKRERKQKLTPVDAAAALDVLRSPGMGLIVSGLLVLIASAPSAMFFSEEGLGLHDSSGYYAMAMALMIVTGLGIAALLIAAGVLMRRAWAYPVCVIATLTAILPFSMAWVFTIPFGLWALVVLLRQDVRELFASGADVGEMLRHPAPPAKPADPRHSGYYAAGQLTGVLVRFLASKQFVIVVCVVGMATVLLPWGKAIFERPDGGLWDGPNLYGWECWTPSIVAFAFLLLLLIVIATGGIRELEVWRPLLLAGFALPILAMSFGFSVIESFLQRFSQVEPLARIDPQGGHFVALAAAVGLLLCAALQFRSSVASR